jgi:hypothetical protein
MQINRKMMRHKSSVPHSSAPYSAAEQRPLVAALTLAAALACLPHSAQAFNFDDLEKVEKVERGERKVREAKAEAARREEEARRQAQQQADDAARQRAASSGGSSGGSSSSSSGEGGRYSVYNDKGAAASWAWFKREIVVKCEGGRKGGEMPSVYLTNSGSWSTTYVSGYFNNFHAAATAACS